MRVSFFMVLSLYAIQLSAQNYGNVWQFGENLGLDFNGCEPEVISGANSGFEACASICNDDGELLLYTNGYSVWNAEHELMPTSSSVLSTLSQTIIIPKPLSEDHYYIISTIIQAQNNQAIEFMEIDMSLDGGLGDIVSQGNEMTNLTVTEQVAATYHSNGVDIWLMLHEYATNAFLAFLVTPDGIDLNPVLSNIGPSHNPSFSNINARGEIKFSPDGTKLAFNANGTGEDENSDLLCLFDFDNSSGQVSSPINLPTSGGEFGLSFSPDNSKLYGATWKAFGFSIDDHNFLYQFDISSNDSTLIANSKYILDSLPVPYGTIKIGPNGKIYVRSSGSEYLSVIQEPDLLGPLCTFEPEGVFLGQQYQYGLNHYIEYQNYCHFLSTEEVDKTNEKKLLQVIDLMGRKSEDVPNTILIYIYDDGSREKIFRVEP